MSASHTGGSDDDDNNDNINPPPLNDADKKRAVLNETKPIRRAASSVINRGKKSDQNLPEELQQTAVVFSPQAVLTTSTLTKVARNSARDFFDPNYDDSDSSDDEEEYEESVQDTEVPVQGNQPTVVLRYIFTSGNRLTPQEQNDLTTALEHQSTFRIPPTQIEFNAIGFNITYARPINYNNFKLYSDLGYEINQWGEWHNKIDLVDIPRTEAALGPKRQITVAANPVRPIKLAHAAKNARPKRSKVTVTKATINLSDELTIGEFKAVQSELQAQLQAKYGENLRIQFEPSMQIHITNNDMLHKATFRDDVIKIIDLIEYAVREVRKSKKEFKQDASQPASNKQPVYPISSVTLITDKTLTTNKYGAPLLSKYTLSNIDDTGTAIDVPLKAVDKSFARELHLAFQSIALTPLMSVTEPQAAVTTMAATTTTSSAVSTSAAPEIMSTTVEVNSAVADMTRMGGLQESFQMFYGENITYTTNPVPAFTLKNSPDKSAKQFEQEISDIIFGVNTFADKKDANAVADKKDANAVTKITLATPLAVNTESFGTDYTIESAGSGSNVSFKVPANTKATHMPDTIKQIFEKVKTATIASSDDTLSNKR
ncbi:MAG TPA: hypothetical protein VLG38_06045 [Gammaproteobacteria bacterium]|nr:hypothetical protein [Gammaproteobacteria bacterium]